MGWLDYYWLIEKYGSVDAAPKAERMRAAKGNSNTPWEAREIAEKYVEDLRRRAGEPGE